MGLARHLIDIKKNAPYYPLKLDKNANLVFTPGVLIAYDRKISSKADIYLRIVNAFYIDCAVQPAAYLGTYVFFPDIIRWKRVSFGGGGGLAIDIRRNWERYASPDIKSRLFRDWGEFEGIIGPFFEIEILYSLKKYNSEFVLNIVPGLPVVAFLTVGIRFPLRKK